MTNLHPVLDVEHDSVLSPVERISEMLFGLFMALTFIGAVSAATAGREEVRTKTCEMPSSRPTL